MKLYFTHGGVCVAWCAAETLLFGGIIYGWGSLVYILKEEQFYADVCKTEIDFQGNWSIDGYKENETTPYKNVIGTITKDEMVPTFKSDTSSGCHEQDSKLNLWFSVAVAFMYIGLAFLGQLTSRLGTQITRHIFTCVFVTGALCIAFSTKEIPWLLCPGLCCIGFSGMVIFATNLQVANLFPRYQSTIVACYCGLFDSSSVVQQLVKVAYANNISRRTSYIAIAVLGAVILTISTVFLLPKKYITRNKLIQRRESLRLQKQKSQSLLESKKDEKTEFEDDTHYITQSARSCLLSSAYAIHVLWMSVNVVLFVTFIGLLNTNLNRLSRGSSHVVSHYLGAFAYTTMCTVLAGVFAGMTYDCQRKRYLSYRRPARQWRPVFVPMMLTGVFSISVYGLLLVDTVSVMFPVFVLFTLFRSFLYSIGIAFINDAFPIKHFGLLYGLMTFVNGVFSMLQYGFLSWCDKYDNAYVHVNIFLLICGVLALLHPVLLWYKSFKAKRDPVLKGVDDPMDQEVVISEPA